MLRPDVEASATTQTTIHHFYSDITLVHPSFSLSQTQFHALIEHHTRLLYISIKSDNVLPYPHPPYSTHSSHLSISSERNVFFRPIHSQRHPPSPVYSLPSTMAFLRCDVCFIFGLDFFLFGGRFFICVTKWLVTWYRYILPPPLPFSSTHSTPSHRL